MTGFPSEPWPIWEDSYINSVKWHDMNLKRDRQNIIEDSEYDGEMPPDVSVSYWERPNFEDMNIKWTLAAEDHPLDLVKNNDNLMKYKTMTTIISSIHSLMEVGRLKPFEPDCQSALYSYNGGPNWEPWNHIYFQSKAGRSSVHSLSINKGGLYFVRLFYMGNWRRITVNDFFPYSENGELLVPRSKNRYNIWPLILAKALLQVASLSWEMSGDLKDFSIISCLTGWTRFNVDCRNLNINQAWNVIRMHMIENEDVSQEEHSYCLTGPHRTCLLHDTDNNYYCRDNVDWKNIFLLFSQTNTEVENISPSAEHVVFVTGAGELVENDIDKLPDWKKIRWVEWARKHGGLREVLGVVKRKVEIYSCFRKMELLNPYSENNIQNLVGKIISNEVKSGQLKDLLLKNMSRGRKQSVNDDNADYYMIFDFSIVFPFIRELDIYYKSVQFKYVQHFVDVGVLEYSRNHSLLKTKAMKDFDQSNQLRAPYKKKYFFLYSNSNFCKEFLVSFSTFVLEKHFPKPCITCEEYNWKSRVHGRILFDLSTYGTITHVLQLGPSVQVCRFWYHLPINFHFMVQGSAPFELLTEENLFVKLSSFSSNILSYGEKIAGAFHTVKTSLLRSPSHFGAIEHYKKTFYPPNYDKLATNEKLTLSSDFNEVFYDSLAEVISSEIQPLSEITICIAAHRVLFNNQKLGERFIEKLSEEERSDFQTLQELFLRQQNLVYYEKIIGELNKIIGGRLLDAKMTRVSLSNMQQPMPEKLPFELKFKVEDLSLLSKPINNIILLRNILHKKPRYLSMYPFHNELELKLVFYDYTGFIDATPVHTWFVIARLLVNVHSDEPTPCYIDVKTNYEKVSMILFDLDTSQIRTSSLAMNNVYHLRRSKAGYVILLYAIPNMDTINIPIHVNWALRVAGTDEGNILHFCAKSPFSCNANLTDQAGVHVKTLNGFYFPNSDNVVGRFMIKTKSSLIVTLLVSIARRDLGIRVVIRGGDRDLCVAEGRGSIMIPVLLLDKKTAGNSMFDPEVYIFRGKIVLMDHWELNRDEKMFADHLRSLTQKENLSLEDFVVTPDSSLGHSGSSDDMYSDEDESGKKNDLKRRHSDFRKDNIDSSDDCPFLSKKEFNTEPFGLFSYSPYWRISLIMDDINNDETLLQLDDNRIKEFEMLKKNWEENDPGRAQRGCELRNEFLNIGQETLIKIHQDQDEVSISDVSDCGIEEGLKLNEFYRESSPKGPKGSRKKMKTRLGSAVKETSSPLKKSTSLLKTSSSPLDHGNDLSRSSDSIEDAPATVKEQLEPLDDTMENMSLSKPEIPEEDYGSDEMKYEEIENSVFQPADALLTDLSEISKISAVINGLSKSVNDIGKESILHTLLKQYSTHSNILFKVEDYDLDDYYFDLTPRLSRSDSFIKDLQNQSKVGDWTNVQEMVARTLWPISNQSMPGDFFKEPMEFQNEIDLVKEAVTYFFTVKGEADERVCQIQQRATK